MVPLCDLQKLHWSQRGVPGISQLRNQTFQLAGGRFSLYLRQVHDERIVKAGIEPIDPKRRRCVFDFIHHPLSHTKHIVVIEGSQHLNDDGAMSVVEQVVRVELPNDVKSRHKICNCHKLDDEQVILCHMISQSKHGLDALNGSVLITSTAQSQCISLQTLHKHPVGPEVVERKIMAVFPPDPEVTVIHPARADNLVEV